MAPAETREKDLSILKIDRAHKESLEEKRGPARRPMLYIAGGAAVLLLLVGLILLAARAKAPEVEIQRVMLTEGSSAGPVVLTAGGYIVAHHTIQVSSKVVGKVAWVGIEKGDYVKEGQVLVRLEDDEYRAQLAQAEANLAVAQARLRELETGSRPQEIEAARAAMEQAEANFRYAEVNLNRVREMARQAIVSQAQLDDAETRFEVAKRQLESARKNYELVKIGPRIEQIDYARAQVKQAQAAVDYARTMLDATLIRSPVTGTVLQRLIEKGEMVSTMNFGGPGGVKASVASIADLSDLQVELDINQNDFPRVSFNQECTVTADAYPDRQYKGVVAEIAPEANRQKATIQVKVKILSPDSYLRPEMNAHVSFLAPASQAPRRGAETLAIPRSALVEREGKTGAFVLNGSRVVLRTIKPGRQLGDRVEVVEGLKPNDRVVVRGLEGLSSGQRVKIKVAN